MKIYEVAGKVGEQGRVLKPGRGHEEMVLVVKGEVTLTGQCSETVLQGQAVHLVGETSCFAGNRTNAEAVYVIAGGHAEVGHQH